MSPPQKPVDRSALFAPWLLRSLARRKSCPAAITGAGAIAWSVLAAVSGCADALK